MILYALFVAVALMPLGSAVPGDSHCDPGRFSIPRPGIISLDYLGPERYPQHTQHIAIVLFKYCEHDIA